MDTVKRLQMKNRSKWPSSGRHLPVIERQNAVPASAISSATGERQPMITMI